MHADARFVGGRSGGPAAAVATGMAYGAASADLGGTLRLPAAYSGTVGLMASRVGPPGDCCPDVHLPKILGHLFRDWSMLHNSAVPPMCALGVHHVQQLHASMLSGVSFYAGAPAAARPAHHSARL